MFLNSQDYLFILSAQNYWKTLLGKWWIIGIFLHLYFSDICSMYKYEFKHYDCFCIEMTMSLICSGRTGAGCGSTLISVLWRTMSASITSAITTRWGKETLRAIWDGQLTGTRICSFLQVEKLLTLLQCILHCHKSLWELMEVWIKNFNKTVTTFLLFLVAIWWLGL